MARDLMEFYFTQHLPWKTSDGPGHFPGTHCKVLSQDDETAELTQLCRLSSQWRQVMELDFELEVYVLDGALRLNGRQLHRDCYARVPPRERIEIASDGGAVMLCWLNAAPTANPDDVGVTVRNVLETPWDTTGVPDGLDYMGIRRKFLNGEAATGMVRTFLLFTMPHNFPPGWTCRQETHPCAEEGFMLAGDLAGPHGVMTTGAYFWRPQGVVHGPYGSRNGSLTLIRFREGMLHVDWHDEHRLTFDPPFHPALPPRLMASAGTVYSGQERF